MEAVLKAEVLRDLVNALSVISETVKLEFEKDKVTVKCTDKAHVSMVTLSLSSEVFSQYETSNEGDICIDLTKMKDILKLANVGDELRIVTKDGKMVVKFGRLRRSMSLVKAEVPNKIPKLTLPCSVVIPVEKFKTALMACQTISDAVELSIGEDNFSVKADNGTDDVEASYPKDKVVEMTCARDLTLSGEKGEPRFKDLVVKSNYSLEYLQNILRGIPADVETIKIEFGRDYPARVSFKFANEKGEAFYFVAPRIET